MSEQGSARSEVPQGCVVDQDADQACLRKYPPDEPIRRARVHTTECALMGHRVESGYGRVEEEGRPLLLEPAATPRVVEVLEGTSNRREVRPRATGQMRTTRAGKV